MSEQTQDEDTIAALISRLAHGTFNDEASKELKSLVTEMAHQERTVGGKPKGAITLKIAFTLDRGVMETQGDVSVKRPAKVRARSFLYPGPDGRLSENDIRQGQLFGEQKRAEPKDVSTGAASKVLAIDTKMAQANDR